jgi:GNAT superfamily N-acetyltransferase
MIEERPAQQDLKFLEDQIIKFNMARVNAYDGRELAAFVRDANHRIVAGISGYTWAGMCEVQFLWVEESVRGQGYGSRLLAAVEDEARARGCSVIILGSYSFQAPDFYRQHGYENMGHIGNCPPNHTFFFFAKRL